MYDHRLESDAPLTEKPSTSTDATLSAGTQDKPRGLPGAALAGQEISQEWVVAAARRVIREIAPRELAVFSTMAGLWLAAGDRPPQGRPAAEAAPGPAINAVLLSELVFPVISGALGEILGNNVWERIRPQRQPARRHMTGSGGDCGDPGGRAATRLTLEQAGALHGACQRHALALGLSPITAAKLADAVGGTA